MDKNNETNSETALKWIRIMKPTARQLLQLVDKNNEINTEAAFK